VRRLRDYLTDFQRETRRRCGAGLTLWEAAEDISLDSFRGWADEKRILLTLNALYREFGAGSADPVQAWASHTDVASRSGAGSDLRPQHASYQHRGLTEHSIRDELTMQPM
jgi:hypothetical protein